MKRRVFLKQVGAAAGAALLLPACGKNELVANATLVIASLKDTSRVVRPLKPSLADKLDLMVSVAEKLKAAVEKNNATDAINFLDQLIPAFEQIIEQDIRVFSVETQTMILAALALADIGLHFLAAYYTQNAAMLPKAGRQSRISAFSQKRVWGRDFKH